MSSTSSPPLAQGTGPEKSPLSSLNLNFLKALNEKRTTRDGNPPKRRGPKPDSKPALTRRQELNRQAQRTHRERKELYIKALEDEVLRLKEVFSNVSQDKDKLAEENRQLKSLLQQNGLSSPPPGLLDDVLSTPSMGYTSSGSISGSYAAGSSTAFTPPMASMSSGPSMSNHGLLMHSHGLVTHSPSSSVVDYDQAGIDFVLALEKPCMDHMPFVLDKTMGGGKREPCGHALMASCPPEPFSDLTAEIPFGIADNSPAGSEEPVKTWELSKGDLATLLDLSTKLDLDGEITPVMAWGIILGHYRLTELTRDDILNIMEELKGKVRCYGFGAVMEEFEVRDALNAVLSSKPDIGLVF
ncbi:hypothetical protein F4780DRAFT_682365 [Xylariomycetidae sp. FL0641]|nr:hypothetical protein F4780DRAFT_682365 [Xylariomycetidae sp. FL0641]